VPYTSNIPYKNAIPCLEDISLEDFQSKWCDKPFILTKPVRQWPVYRTWDTAKLVEDFSDICFRAEAVDWPLRTYVEYINNNFDESPLYLFDRGFVEKMSLSIGRNSPLASYWIPDCFGEDLFAALGSQRPDSRWLIIGPARSGSTFHKDPNATSAWNAVIRGSKYWIMFPTTPDSPPPPGVYVSEDQSEVTSPLSIAEWLLGFHTEARRTHGCLEGICKEGEVLHVPSGWWHLVVNLEPSIAITQNFVPRNHLPSVLSFLKDKPDQVSGFKMEVQDPYATFVECLKCQHSEMLAWAIAEAGNQVEARKRKWDVAIGGSEGQSFSFGFGGDGDSDEEIP
jgi:Cupin-like domain